MPPILGLELHTLGFSLASLGVDLAVEARALIDHDGVFAHTGARPWKWALGAENDVVAVVTAAQLLAGIEESVGAGARVVVAVPAGWGERPRRSLQEALGRTTLDALRLVQSSQATPGFEAGVRCVVPVRYKLQDETAAPDVDQN
jgi:hypothetical protein